MRKRVVCWAFGVILGIRGLPSGPAWAEEPRQGELVDMVVAQVDATVITLSELVAETRLVLLRRAGPEAASRVRATPPLLRAVLKSMVNRELLLAESRRLDLGKAPEEEVQAAFERIKKQFVSPEDFDGFLEGAGFSDPTVSGPLGAPPESLLAVLRSELQVERFLDVRLRASLSVSDGDVIACFEANKARFAGISYPLVEQRIRIRLREQQRQRGIEGLLDQFERRAHIRYAPGFEPPDDAPTEPSLSETEIQCPEKSGQ